MVFSFVDVYRCYSPSRINIINEVTLRIKTANSHCNILPLITEYFIERCYRECLSAGVYPFSEFVEKNDCSRSLIPSELIYSNTFVKLTHRNALLRFQIPTNTDTIFLASIFFFDKENTKRRLTSRAKWQRSERVLLSMITQWIWGFVSCCLWQKESRIPQAWASNTHEHKYDSNALNSNRFAHQNRGIAKILP